MFDQQVPGKSRQYRWPHDGLQPLHVEDVNRAGQSEAAGREHHDGAGERIELAAREWPVHDRVLRDLLAGPEALVAALRGAGAPVLFSEVEPPADDARFRFVVPSGTGVKWEE